VAGQDLTARFTDTRPIAFQAVQDADNVVVLVFDELLAETHDVGAASGALFCISLALSESTGNGCHCEHYGKSNGATHDVLSCGKFVVRCQICFCQEPPAAEPARYPNEKRLSEDFVPIIVAFDVRSPDLLCVILIEHSANSAWAYWIQINPALLQREGETTSGA
jgi:hypothetical protein